MSATPKPTRAASVAATATTMVAFVAMSTAVAGACPLRSVDVTARGETPVARAVAAVVAAVARDLAGAERTTVAVARLDPAELSAPVPCTCTMTAQVAPFAVHRLAERLLDLPPPCA